jgi:hypothetical protein
MGVAAAIADSAAGSVPVVTAGMAQQLAVEQKVCGRSLVRRVIDQATGGESRVAIPCGSTRPIFRGWWWRIAR